MATVCVPFSVLYCPLNVVPKAPVFVEKHILVLYLHEKIFLVVASYVATCSQLSLTPNDYRI